jgi:hypothetical protein
MWARRLWVRLLLVVREGLGLMSGKLRRWRLVIVGVYLRRGGGGLGLIGGGRFVVIRRRSEAGCCGVGMWRGGSGSE